MPSLGQEGRRTRLLLLLCPRRWCLRRQGRPVHRVPRTGNVNGLLRGLKRRVDTNTARGRFGRQSDRTPLRRWFCNHSHGRNFGFHGDIQATADGLWSSHDSLANGVEDNFIKTLLQAPIERFRVQINLRMGRGCLRVPSFSLGTKPLLLRFGRCHHRAYASPRSFQRRSARP